MIWEAARATSAAPTFFKRISIGPEGAKVGYIDAGLGYNNPIEQLLKEASDVFGTGRPLGCVVSIGTGETYAQDYQRPDWFEKIVPVRLVRNLEKIVTNAATIAETYAAKFHDDSSIYFRFNVGRGLGLMPLNEWQKLANVTFLTEGYLKLNDVSTNIDRLVTILAGESEQIIVPVGAVGTHR